MAVKYSSGKFTQAVCDRCGEWFKLNKLKKLVLKDNVTNIKVCSRCWEPSHPQLRQGQYPVVDAQAVREPRPDKADAQFHPSALLLETTPELEYYGLINGNLTQENGDLILT